MINSTLLDMLKKYYGLPPYNGFCNICYYDGHFMDSIKEKNSEDEIQRGIEYLQQER